MALFVLDLDYVIWVGGQAQQLNQYKNYEHAANRGVVVRALALTIEVPGSNK